MRLHIDIREACRPHPTGKGIWTRGLLAELLMRPVALTLHADAPLPPALQALAEARPESTDILISSRGLLWHLRTALRLRRAGPEAIYLSPTRFIVPALLGRTVACVPVVHDLIAFRDDEHASRATFIERLTLDRTLRTARHILTVSAATRSELLKRTPGLDPSTVTSVFAGPLNSSPPPAARDRNIILCLGTLCPRKNQERLVRAYARLPATLRHTWTLVLVGSRGWQDDAILRAVENTPGAEWRRYVPDAEVEDLLHHAKILALPSHNEGFGLPVLDAFQRGIPVLTSNRGALQELAGGTAFIVNPDRTAEIARGLEHLMSDPALQADFAKRGPIRAARYSWSKTATLVLAALAD